MNYILREYEKNGYHFIEYTSDGKTVSAIVQAAITDIVPDPLPVAPLPTIEEQILAETQYQTALLEVNALGGNV